MTTTMMQSLSIKPPTLVDVLPEQIKQQMKGLKLNSKDIVEGDVFLACAGTKFHGVAYAGEAIKNGAIAIVWEPSIEINEMPAFCVHRVQQDGYEQQLEIPLIKVEKLTEKLSALAAQFYQQASKSLKVVGITGTNGKTSVSYFIAQCLQTKIENTDNNNKCAVIGTLGNGLLTDIKAGTHTTPDAITVQKLLAEMKQQQASHVLMEVSSHALSQYRVHDVCFDVAVFTNLSQDHLDYHGDMQHYAQEKRKLFAFPSLSAQVINADDQEGRVLLTMASEYEQQHIIAYSCGQQCPDVAENTSLLYANNIQFSEQGISFDLTLELAKKRVTDVENEQQAKGIVVPLMGLFNLSNVLASVGVLVAFNYPLEQIIKRLAAIKPIDGRMQKVQTEKKDKATIIVDYAHTPDALEKSLQALVAHCTGKLWCVFGCGGNRDKGKRKLMGQIASKYADEVVITSDNPRDENPMDIIEDIKTGMSGNYCVQENREKAIYYAVEKAVKNDVILVAGKGHEDYQEIKQLRYPFSDLGISKQALAS